MKKLWIRSAARADLLEQYTYFLEKDLLEIANRFLDSAEQAVKLLQQMPSIGAKRFFKHPRLQGIRTWPIPGFQDIRIYYLADETTIRIIRILHGKRNVLSLLEQIP